MNINYKELTKEELHKIEGGLISVGLGGIGGAGTPDVEHGNPNSRGEFKHDAKEGELF